MDASTLLRDQLRDAHAALERTVAGLGEAELGEEDLGQLRVVVLAGVEDDLVDARRPQREGERSRLDELWAVTHDREHAHRG